MRRNHQHDSVADRLRKGLGNVANKARAPSRSIPAPIPEQEPPPHVETFTADELMGMDLPDQKWAVEGVFPSGCSILAGKPKLGKSWLALNIALAVASGGMALGNISVVAGDVLYLALEDTKRRLRDRLTKMLGSQDSKPPARLTMATSWPRADKGGLAAIREWLDTHKQARLIIIDTWAKFKRVRVVKSNEYETDYADASEVKTLADECGVAVLFLHHCRKMGAVDPLEEVSGTLGLTGAADAITVLRRERGQHDATLHITGRDVEERELALRWDAEYCLWSILGQAEEYRIGKEQQEIIDLLRTAKKPLSPGEAATLLGKTREAVKGLLWRMGNKGTIKPVGDGTYTLAHDEQPEQPSNHSNHSNQSNRAVALVSQQSNRQSNQDEDYESPFPK